MNTKLKEDKREISLKILFKIQVAISIHKKTLNTNPKVPKETYKHNKIRKNGQHASPK